MTELQQRVAALEKAGWIVVSREPGLIETYFRGSRIIEWRPTLVEAVERAEEAQARFDAAEDRPTEVRTGLDHN